MAAQKTYGWRCRHPDQDATLRLCLARLALVNATSREYWLRELERIDRRSSVTRALADTTTRKADAALTAVNTKKP